MKKKKSIMQHSFSQIPSANIQRSVLDRTHKHLTTMDAGYLVPFYVDEALPGDTFNLNATLFARLATPIVPIMDNMYMDTHYFAVPYRLLWDNFQKMMGEQANPDDSTDYLTPLIGSGPNGFEEGSLADYFGLPVGVGALAVSALFHRAYNLIYSEWYRDQNLQDSPNLDTSDVSQPKEDYPLRRRGKRHDYFTSALPWPQKGPGVELPIGDAAPVVTTGLNPLVDTATITDQVISTNAAGGNTLNYGGAGTGLSETVHWGTETGLEADLSSASAASINSLRQAFQMQRLLERDARGGTRYTEILRAHFGVISPDARLQRPEYLGGGTAKVNITPVPQTESSAGSTPQGNLAGFGLVADGGGSFTKSFTEHCVVMGIVSVRADLTYQRGVPRMFSRRSRFDFYWPALAHLGEQAILNKEIYYQNDPVDEDVFGYQERWAEYRYYPSKITGKFRSTDPLSLDVWHLSQDFADLPVLSSEFIEEDPPVNRVVAVTSEPQFILDTYIQCRTARPMPVYSVPGKIDHF